MKRMKYLLILFILFFVSALRADEIEYFKFWANIPDYSTGYLQTQIKFTYRSDEKIINLYYQSDYHLVALIFPESERTKLLGYIQKYEEWNKKAIEEKVAFVKRIGILNLKLFFKYADNWYEGSDALTFVDFYSLALNSHCFLMQFIKIFANKTLNLEFRPELLYFNYNDTMILKKAFDQSFIDQEINKIKSKQVSVDDEFK